MEKLTYRPGVKFAPIPPWERGLQTITAELFVKIPEAKGSLEGLCFDRKGDLYFTEVGAGKVYKCIMDTKEIQLIWTADPAKDWKVAAVKIHKDGRLFVCCCGTGGHGLNGRANVKTRRNGALLVMNPDGTDVQTIVEGYNINDMCFDADGGIYFDDYVGTYQNPDGGIYYLTPDLKTMTCVMADLASPNGVCLSKDGKSIWTAEMATGLIHKYNMAERIGFMPYHIIGGNGPDSISIDNDDNLYIACYRQGRFLVLNKEGHPIGHILMPGRDEGHNLNATHAMCRPGHEEVYMTCYDFPSGEQGAAIYVAGSFAPGNESAYQFQ